MCAVRVFAYDKSARVGEDALSDDDAVVKAERLIKLWEVERRGCTRGKVRIMWQDWGWSVVAEVRNWERRERRGD